MLLILLLLWVLLTLLLAIRSATWSSDLELLTTNYDILGLVLVFVIEFFSPFLSRKDFQSNDWIVQYNLGLKAFLALYIDVSALKR